MLDAPRDPAAERSAVGAYCVYIAVSLVAIHFGLTKRGTPERLAHTHLLWWYPFVFLLLYHAFAAVRELHVDLETRWTGTTEESYVFFRLYVAAQVCGCFVEVGTTELGAKLFQMLAHHVISIVAYGVALTDGRCEENLPGDAMHFHGLLYDELTLVLEALGWRPTARPVGCPRARRGWNASSAAETSEAPRRRVVV